jgi:hypothetical protein
MCTVLRFSEDEMRRMRVRVCVFGGGWGGFGVCVHWLGGWVDWLVD